MTTAVTPPASGGLRALARDQKKVAYVALALIVAGFWIVGQLGEWGLGACISIGVAFGLLNHLATELWLLGIITSGKEVTRNQMIRSTVVRLVILTVAAVAVAVAFWPSGIGLLLGLALFRCIALVMTSIPLLKELKKA
ncbi:MAG TPA: hypothetical protein VHZ06_06955 [Marmoricola sp.]|jgi:hypothetical protein|nr:hypothetical protein [Marmoricola sp.]